MAELIFASPDHLKDIRKIWMTCFSDDTEEVVDSFLSRITLSEECLLCCVEGMPVAMTFLLPVELQVYSRRYPVQYVYAVGTLPAYRRCGYSSALLNWAKEIAKERGQIASCLQPAQPSLMAFYQNLGYQPFFEAYHENWTLEEMKIATRKTVPLGMPKNASDSYAKMRNLLLSERPAWIRWQPRFADYTAKWAMRSGGGVLARDNAVLLLEPSGDTLLIREMLCPTKQLSGVFEMLYTMFPYKTYEIIHPAIEGMPVLTTGMWCPLSPVGEQLLAKKEELHPYLGLTLA